MKIVADQNMPLVEELFGRFGKAELLPGRDISAADLADADVLLVRSVTQVNEHLLAGSTVKFVGSATIGTDHIDCDYLSEKAISFAHAPGCNARAVVQYDLSVFCRLQPDWRTKEIGIIGCGNVGGRLYLTLKALGVSCRVYDPFLTQEKVADLVDFADVLETEIICLHTPYTTDGPYPTHHLFDRQALEKLKPGTLLLNAGRGAVIDNAALLDLLEKGADISVALDVWEGEPDLNLQLMNKVNLATPHIAGYSREGKEGGTRMVFEAFCRWRNAPGFAPLQFPFEQKELLRADTVNQAIIESYDVSRDDQCMREAMESLKRQGIESAQTVAQVFDRLRRDYPQRREFSHFKVYGIDDREGEKGDLDALKAIGFTC